MRETIKTIFSPDQRRRVRIFRRPCGALGFEEDYFSAAEFENCWIPVGKQIETVCSELEIAEREARGRVEWLRSVE